MTENHAWGLFCVGMCIFTGFIAYMAGKNDGITKGQILAADLIMERHAKTKVVAVESYDRTFYFSDCWISGESNQGILTFHPQR